jgi:hypothetical protein
MLPAMLLLLSFIESGCSQVKYLHGGPSLLQFNRPLLHLGLVLLAFPAPAADEGLLPAVATRVSSDFDASVILDQAPTRPGDELEAHVCIYPLSLGCCATDQHFRVARWKRSHMPCTSPGRGVHAAATEPCQQNTLLRSACWDDVEPAKSRRPQPLSHCDFRQTQSGRETLAVERS